MPIRSFLSLRGLAALSAGLALAATIGWPPSASASSFATLANKTLADSPVTVSATATSGLAVTFSTSTPAVSIAGGTNGETISLLVPGTCTVRANRTGETIYGPAPVVIHSFGVT